MCNNTLHTHTHRQETLLHKVTLCRSNSTVNYTVNVRYISMQSRKSKQSKASSSDTIASASHLKTAFIRLLWNVIEWRSCVNAISTLRWDSADTQYGLSHFIEPLYFLTSLFAKRHVHSTVLCANSVQIHCFNLMLTSAKVQRMGIRTDV